MVPPWQPKMLSSLWVSRTGSAPYWCALQEALYKCIDTIHTNYKWSDGATPESRPIVVLLLHLKNFRQFQTSNAIARPSPPLPILWLLTDLFSWKSARSRPLIANHPPHTNSSSHSTAPRLCLQANRPWRLLVQRPVPPCLPPSIRPSVRRPPPASLRADVWTRVKNGKQAPVLV